VQEGAERFRDWHLVLSETDEHLAVPVGDLVGGHGGYPGLLLAEQQHQGAGDPVGGVEVVVVEQPGQLCPALVGVGGRAAAALRAGDLEGGAVACFSGPREEVTHVAGAGSGGEPVLDIGVAAVGQRSATPGQPGQELGRGFDLQSGVGGVGPWPGAGLGGAA
jgi:hypothetical protein